MCRKAFETDLYPRSALKLKAIRDYYVNLECACESPARVVICEVDIQLTQGVRSTCTSLDLYFRPASPLLFVPSNTARKEGGGKIL